MACWFMTNHLCTIISSMSFYNIFNIILFQNIPKKLPAEHLMLRCLFSNIIFHPFSVKEMLNRRPKSHNNNYKL